MRSSFGQYIEHHIIFNATQNSIVVAEFDLALADFLYNLYISSVGYVTSLGR